MASCSFSHPLLGPQALGVLLHRICRPTTIFVCDASNASRGQEGHRCGPCEAPSWDINHRAPKGAPQPRNIGQFR
ncbi:hypothetical protein Nepgr_017712 [Nepenthes gracilis]|uniref:Uncharacterized protein n=1 Tax=Nepenthes gracilis TaxID=150966 RepID=A0AAD3XTL7_NEPGR|nr:hypothetical protein Nepgr_017712 [Nepenthes gracilis]